MLGVFVPVDEGYEGRVGAVLLGVDAAFFVVVAAEENDGSVVHVFQGVLS